MHYLNEFLHNIICWYFVNFFEFFSLPFIFQCWKRDIFSSWFLDEFLGKLACTSDLGSRFSVGNLQLTPQVNWDFDWIFQCLFQWCLTWKGKQAFSLFSQIYWLSVCLDCVVLCFQKYFSLGIWVNLKIKKVYIKIS